MRARNRGLSVYKRDGSKFWCFSFYHNGKRIQRTTNVESKKALLPTAVHYAEAYIEEYSRPHTRLKDFTRNFYVEGKCSILALKAARGKVPSPASIEKARYTLSARILPAFGDMDLKDIRGHLIEDWLISLKVSNSYKNFILVVFSEILKEARRQDIIEDVPKIDSFSVGPSKGKAFSMDELRLLFSGSIEDLDARFSGREHSTLFLTMASTGIRIGEALALTEEDYRTGPPAYLIIRSSFTRGRLGPTKNRKVRVVPVHPDVAAILGKPRGRLFLTTYQRASAAYAKALKLVGLQGRIHDLRHTFNTLIHDSVPKDIRLGLLGHSSEAVNREYTHVSVEAAAESLVPFLSSMPSVLGELSPPHL